MPDLQTLVKFALGAALALVPAVLFYQHVIRPVAYAGEGSENSVPTCRSMAQHKQAMTGPCRIYYFDEDCVPTSADDHGPDARYRAPKRGCDRMRIIPAAEYTAWRARLGQPEHARGQDPSSLKAGGYLP